MKKIFFLMLCSVLAFSFQSCSDDDDDNSEWRNTNEAAFNNVAANPEYKPATTPEGPGTIYYKVLKSGTGTKKPLYTSQVSVLYKGTYYDGTVFDPGTSVSLVPKTFSTNGVVSGFSIALQNMVVGDRWEVWVPWNLGYGSSGKYDTYGTQQIPGYSTLVFDVELLEITQYPTK